MLISLQGKQDLIIPTDYSAENKIPDYHFIVPLRPLAAHKPSTDMGECQSYENLVILRSFVAFSVPQMWWLEYGKV